MEIKVKLMGALRPKTPEGGRLELSEGCTVAEVLLTLEIGDELIQSVMLNGTMVRERGSALSEGDELMILAPVGGG